VQPPVNSQTRLTRKNLQYRNCFCISSGMDISKRAELLEQRAKSHGLRMRDVCVAADLDFSTFWRWKKGEVKPSLEAWERLQATIDHLCPNMA
jgi:hypothetical protein